MRRVNTDDLGRTDASGAYIPAPGHFPTLQASISRRGRKSKLPRPLPHPNFGF